MSKHHDMPGGYLEASEPFLERAGTKRKRTDSLPANKPVNKPATGTADQPLVPTDDENDLVAGHTLAPPKLRSMFMGVRPPPLTYPKSLFQPYCGTASSQLPISREEDVLTQYSNRHRRGKAVDPTYFHSLKLSHFSFYRPLVRDEYGEVKPGCHSLEFQPLHHLNVKSGHNVYLFDGILDDGEQQSYVQGVPFSLYSIGNYGLESAHSVDDQIWIQSSYTEERASDVWYQLMDPAPEYRRYHTPFTWLANLAKYFIEYLDCSSDVRISSFKKAFHTHISLHHGHDTHFDAWLEQYGQVDFRQAIATNAEFLYKEAFSLGKPYTQSHIWSEIRPGGLRAIRLQKARQTNTIVTSFVYKCFEHLPFGQYLEVIEPSPAPGGKCYATKLDRGSHRPHPAKVDSLLDVLHARASGSIPAFPVQTVKMGDVVAVRRDVQSVWRTQSHVWFAYVQAIKVTQRGSTRLEVIWLYEPSDTSCAGMRYPYENELFFSDHCNCNDSVFGLEDVLGVVPTTLFGTLETIDSGFFVRQTYLVGDAKFTTLKRSDLRCCHAQRNISALDRLKERYTIGDTILYRRADDPAVLEPAEIVNFSVTGELERVIIRKLPRRKMDPLDQDDAKPNELLYSAKCVPICPRRIIRKCYVRFFTEQEKRQRLIPPPYCRDGNADAFYITSEHLAVGSSSVVRPLSKFPSSLRQGFLISDAPPRPLLKGMDLFCGGGSFGRGLQEGGAVINKWAIDYNREAIHTYHANLDDRDETRLFFGSVNDYLAKALKGGFNDTFPHPREVDFISAGSPCQGFSPANSRRYKEQSLRNCSLVASVASFVDYYRPRYAVLENVISIANKTKGQSECVFSQLLCCLIGMGYQVQQFCLDAWSFGSPQRRSRLFVSIAAPGLELPSHPALSHSHPPNKRERSIGLASNGEPFGVRKFEPTPFEFVTAAQATADLPNIDDAHVDTCIRFPDHRNAGNHRSAIQILISQIPRFPREQSAMTAYARGRLAQPQIDTLRFNIPQKDRSKSASWKRVNPDGLFATVTTEPHAACTFTGTIIHWDQPRVCTVMEARRAQSFPDHEVLVGSPRVQWIVLGNSVPRTVALALGMSLREAWLANPPEQQQQQEEQPQPGKLNEKRYLQEVACTLNNPFRIELAAADHLHCSPAKKLGSAAEAAESLENGKLSHASNPRKRQ